MSTSDDERVPLTVGVPDVALLTPLASTTLPALVPVITAASFCPLIVTVTTCAVPSSEYTVNESVIELPTLSACTAASSSLRVYVHAPSAVTSNVPCPLADAAPAATAWNALELSTSADVRVPVAVAVPGVPLPTPPASTTLQPVTPLMTAASLRPSIVTVTSCAVPSSEYTVNVSRMDSPTLSA